MILILSQSYEQSTDNVMDWLQYRNASFIRINSVDFYFNGHANLAISNSGTNLLIQDINDNKFKCVWLRRWGIGDNEIKLHTKSPNAQNTIIDIKKLVRNEFTSLKNFLFLRWRDKKWLTHPTQNTVNKLSVLQTAVDVGLVIPTTNIGICLDKTANKYITKAIGEMDAIAFNKSLCLSYTTVINSNELSSKNKVLSLTQNLIEKKYEIRAFFFYGKFYSMAIFSQEDSQTQVDFRRYNNVKPNRTVPFNLPKNVEEKLTLLMARINLDHGSIDMIVSTEGEFVFLEVNPVGQFGMVSEPCNYYLEELFASKLINLNNLSDNE
jgi:ATP-GRASP peptide maturase of grasp-with-spasm system